MIVAILIALGVGFFSSYWYFTWLKKSLERTLKSKKPGPFKQFLALRLIVASVWLAGMAILFGRVPSLLFACVIGIFAGRVYAFKSR
ncbi:MAG: hypothetical protein FWD15_00470 [Alphaproteobacteria bacterium]|nr:hypothetical protein [Alphaproteobacteria bacterium]